MSIATHGLTHLSLAVADPERSLRFYERLLGVREYYRDDVMIMRSVRPSTTSSRSRGTHRFKQIK